MSFTPTACSACSRTLLGSKASVPDPQHLVCDWASDLFYSAENDKFDEEMDMMPIDSQSLPDQTYQNRGVGQLAREQMQYDEDSGVLFGAAA